MDSIGAVSEVQHARRRGEPGSVVVQSGNMAIRDLTLTPEKLDVLWKLIQRHSTLFSDLTRGDDENFIRAITAPNTLWYEVLKYDTVVGLVWFGETHQIVDCVVHLVFFDRMPSEKVPVLKELLKWMFDSFPLQRMTATPPEIYFRTIKVLERLGFTREGTKREAVLIGGKWINQALFGVTRREVGLML
jgi:hypothetical protein